MVRVFWDNDHAVLLKGGVVDLAEQHVVGNSIAAINFGEPDWRSSWARRSTHRRHSLGRDELPESDYPNGGGQLTVNGPHCQTPVWLVRQSVDPVRHRRMIFAFGLGPPALLAGGVWTSAPSFPPGHAPGERTVTPRRRRLAVGGQHHTIGSGSTTASSATSNRSVGP